MKIMHSILYKIIYHNLAEEEDSWRYDSRRPLLKIFEIAPTSERTPFSPFSPKISFRLTISSLLTTYYIIALLILSVNRKRDAEGAVDPLPPS